MLGEVLSMRRLMVGVLLLALGVVPPVEAQAQEEITADIQHFTGNGDFRSFARVRSARILPHLRPGFSLVVDYANNPLQSALIDEDGNHRVEGAVEHMVGAHLHAAFAPLKFMEIGLHMPVVQFQGYGAAASAYLDPPTEDVGVGTGDLRLEARFIPLSEERFIGVELTPYVTFPTGREDYLMGSGLPSFGVTAAVSKHWQRFHFAAHAGLQIQPGFELVGDSFVFEDRFHYGVGVGVTPILDVLDINLEAVGAVFIGQGLQNVEQRSITRELHSPFELNVTGRVHLPKNLSVVFGGGPGLSPAVGTPLFRVFAGLSWAPTRAKEVVKEPELATLVVGVNYQGKHLADTSVVLQEAEGEQMRVDIGDQPVEIEVPFGTAWSAAASRDCLAGTGGASVDDERVALTIEMIPERNIPVNFRLRDTQGAPPEEATIRWNQDPDCIGCVPEEKAAVLAGDLRQFVCEGEHEVVVESEGHRVVRSTIKAEPGSEHEVEVELLESQIEVVDGQIRLLRKVYFEFASAVIQERSFELLKEVSETILASPQFTMIEVQGHTDSVGSDESNQLLSEARAKSVAEFLTAQGVAGSRLRSKGFGESSPLVDNSTDENRALNRRVEFLLNPDGELGEGAADGNQDLDKDDRPTEQTQDDQVGQGQVDAPASEDSARAETPSASILRLSFGADGADSTSAKLTLREAGGEVRSFSSIDSPTSILLSEGQWTATATEGCLVGSETVQVSGGAKDLDIELQPNRSAPVKIVFSDENGPIRISGRLEWLNEGTCTQCIPAGTTLERSSELQDDLCPGDYSLVISAKGYAPLGARLTLVEDKVNVVRLKLKRRR